MPSGIYIRNKKCKPPLVKEKYCDKCKKRYVPKSNGQKLCLECKRRICLFCKDNFIVKNLDSIERPNKFCSKKCRAKWQVGKKSNRWKGGMRKGSDGYTLIRINKKYKRFARYLMEKHLGKKLEKSEDIHHKNNNKVDDRIENLVVMSKKEHGRLSSKKHWNNSQ